MATFSNGESGSSVRTKLNEIINKVEGTSLVGNDIKFGDGAKAIFGAGSDLQIYHNGSHSYINEGGTGNLRILAQNFNVRNPADNESMIIATPDAGVTLYYDNEAKLATTSTGVDVTGTVTADGLTVDGDVSVIKAISYGGSADIDFVLGASNVGGGVNDSKALAWRWKVAGNQNGQLLDLYEIYDNGATNAERKTLTFNGGGDISFYEDTGTTAKFFWDASAESLGIGTTTATTKIDINAFPASGSGASNTNTIGAAFAALHGNTSSNNQALALRTTGAQFSGITGSFYVSQVYAPDNNNALEVFTGNATPLVFGTSATERMRITSSGNVGIGTTSPTRLLDVYKSDTTETVARFRNASTSYCTIDFKDATTTADNKVRIGADTDDLVMFAGSTERLRINSSGSVLIGTPTSVSNNRLVIEQASGDGANSGFYLQRNGAAGTSFKIDIDSSDVVSFRRSTVQAMAITSSGSVGIGTSSPNNALHVESSVSGASTSVAALVNPNSSVIGTGARLWLSGTNATSRGTYIEGQVIDGGNGHALILGTSASTAAPTERFRIDSSGRVGIGTISPTGTLSIDSTGGTSQSIITTSTNGTSYVNLEIGGINATPSIKREITFHTNAASASRTERMRLDSSGNLLVGKTVADNTTQGIRLLGSSGFASFVRSGAEAIIVNRLTDNGDLVEFRKDGAPVGSIGSVSGVASYVVLDPRTSTGTGVGIRGANGNTSGSEAVWPTNGSGGSSDGVITLGNSTARFKDLYLSGGVYLGGTGAANKLDDYEEGTWTPTNTGAALTVTRANYTKVGRMVTVSCHVTANANTSGDWGGLPFTIDAAGYHSGSVGYQNDTASEVWNVLADGGTSFTLRKGATSEQLGSGYNMRMTLTYFTT